MSACTWIVKHPFTILYWWAIAWIFLVYFSWFHLGHHITIHLLGSSLLNLSSVIGLLVPIIILLMLLWNAWKHHLFNILIEGLVYIATIIKQRINPTINNTNLLQKIGLLRQHYNRLKQVEGDIYLGVGLDIDMTEHQERFMTTLHDVMYTLQRTYPSY